MQSVLLETSKGDLVFDLLVEDCPKASTNFLKCYANDGAEGAALEQTSPVRPAPPALRQGPVGPTLPPPFVFLSSRLCKIKYYNNCLFYNVQQSFIVQSGDPTNTGKGGESVWGVLYGEQVWGLGLPAMWTPPSPLPCLPMHAHVSSKSCVANTGPHTLGATEAVGYHCCSAACGAQGWRPRHSLAF